MSDKNVEFLEGEEDLVSSFQNKGGVIRQEEEEPKGVTGFFIKITGLSKKGANILILIITISILLLSSSIFYAGYLNHQVESDFSERVQRFEPQNVNI